MRRATMLGTRTVLVAVLVLSGLVGAGDHAAGAGAGAIPVAFTATGTLADYPCERPIWPEDSCAGTFSGAIVGTLHYAESAGQDVTVNLAWALAGIESQFTYQAPLAGVCPAPSISGRGSATLSGGTVAGVVTMGAIPYEITSVEAVYNYEFSTIGAVAVITGTGGGQITINHTGGVVIGHFGGSAGVAVVSTSTVPACDGGDLAFTITGALTAAT